MITMSQALNITEQRRFERFGFDLGVRFMAGEIAGENARLVDISAGGAAVRHHARPSLGRNVIAYVEGLDRFEGHVARLFRRGFAIEFTMSDRKRQRLTTAIAALSGKDGLENFADRRAVARICGEGETVLCRLDNGEAVECKIIDCSIANANLRAAVRPFIGAGIRVGLSRATVVRHTHEGFAVEFSDYWASRPAADSYYIYH